MGLAYRLLKREVTVADVIDIREDPFHRLTTSPFGVTPKQYEENPPIYGGRSAPWKGVKGLKLDGFLKALIEGKGRLKAVPFKSREALGAGLRKAVAISKAYAKVEGTELFEGKLYPKKCIAQKRWKEEHPGIK